MDMDELLASYDPVDVEYEKRFRDPPVPLAPEPGERRSRLMSFIPSREEAEDILLIGPLRKLTEREENNV